MVGVLSLPWWLATSLLHQENALDEPHILLSCLSSHLPNVWFICLIHHSSLHALGRVMSPCTPICIPKGDTLYLVCSPAKMRYCGVAIGVHYQFLGAISESYVVMGDQCSYPHPS